MAVPTPAFVHKLLGRRANGLPNIADGSSTSSVAIADSIFQQLGITGISNQQGQTLGRLLEDFVAAEIDNRLPGLAAHRNWVINRNRRITEFLQYRHLAALQAALDADATLRAELGSDYLIAPDITVGVETAPNAWQLHAAVSSKFTIRSDRVQNIRHEGIILTRHRRGRHPHFMVVTTEPLPSRLAAIARGTGEVDRVFHVTLDELQNAVAAHGDPQQQATLDEIINQDRLAGFDQLITELSQI